MNVYEAKLVASIAHGALGQMRANGVDPYIVHPKRVAELAKLFAKTYFGYDAGTSRLVDLEVAAWLHDVLEDTKLTRDHLLDFHIDYTQLDLVERLTKTDADKPESYGNYFQGISESIPALIIKCADRCANLEDSLADISVPEPKTPKRWKNYLESTRNDVLPMYKLFPELRAELQLRIDDMDNELPGALKRRHDVVTRQLQEAVDRYQQFLCPTSMTVKQEAALTLLTNKVELHLASDPLAA